MKICYILMFPLLSLLMSASCEETKETYPSAEQLTGIIINEICGAQDDTGESWVELHNTSDKAIDIKGVKVFLTDDNSVRKCIYKAAATTIEPDGYLILSSQKGEIDTLICAAKPIEVYLTAEDGTAIDSFIRETDLNQAQAHKATGSFSRLPSGTSKWYVTSTATQGEENFGYTNRTGLWLWSTHMKSVSLPALAPKGYGHIILHEKSFTSYPQAEVLAWIKQAEALGMTVHVWFQCFYANGKWISPVDDVNKCYRQDLFDQIITRAEGYLDLGVKAIHLDYIRFGGTSYKHDWPESNVTGEGAITEFCRQLSTRLKAKNKHVILSAAIMPERQNAYYYGQNSAAMGQHLDILIPMIYRYNETSEGGKSVSWVTNMTNYFLENAGNAEIWPGTQTYKYSVNQVAGLTQEQLLSDCKDFRQTKATGIMLFRYGLGDFPDVNTLWE